jgi:hypothetical protein
VQKCKYASLEQALSLSFQVCSVYYVLDQYKSANTDTITSTKVQILTAEALRARCTIDFLLRAQCKSTNTEFFTSTKVQVLTAECQVRESPIYFLLRAQCHEKQGEWKEALRELQVDTRVHW